jgi:hypothetical protein
MLNPLEYGWFGSLPRALPIGPGKYWLFAKIESSPNCGLARQLNTIRHGGVRWGRGGAEPPAEAYLRLGHLTGDPLCPTLVATKLPR